LRILLIANTLFEFAVAIAMIFFSPSLFQGQALTVAVARVLGSNALALGTLSLFMQGLTEPLQIRSGLIALTVFHVSVCIIQILNFLDGSIPFPAIIVHLLFAIAFGFFLRQNLSRRG